MTRFQKILIGIFIAYVAVCIPVMVTQLQMRPSQVFISDAADYHNGAAHLVNNGMYTIDGQHPFLEREPGQSIYLAAIYSVFGVGNRYAVFIIQMLAYFGVCLLFIKRLQHSTSDAAALSCLWFLLFLPSIYHILFSFNRELLTLSLFLVVTQAVFGLLKKPTWIDTIVCGAALGFLLITYSPFVYFPVAFIPLLFWYRIAWKYIAVITILMILPLLMWAVRNERITNEFCLTRCNSTVMVWYVRGEQAEHISGVEPFMCLWAEYVSRDWSQRSPYCSFNRVKNMRWPDGVRGTSQQMMRIGEAGKAKIKAHPLNYISFSLFDIIELHLPYLGWGRMYNILASIGQAILYAGIIAAAVKLIRKKIIWKKEYVLLALIMAYTTAVFIVTDATPRYLMPIIFCYCVFAAIGFEWMVRKKKSKRAKK